MNAVIAVDFEYGKEKWWRQQLSPDEWDYDTAQPPQVITARIGGEERKIVSVASKEGTWFAYDAEDGEPIYERVELLDRIEHPALRPGKPVNIFPSALGGVNFSPAAYDPTTNYVINGTVESKSTLIQAKSAADVDRDRVRGDVDTGAINGFGTTPKGWKDYGGLVAVDVDSGRVAWKTKLPEPERGGITTTASGLGFYGDGNGEMRAFDTKTGKILWRYQTGAQISAGPTIYEIDGKQYVAIAVGGTFTSSQGGTASRIDVFALGGQKSTAKPPNTKPPAAVAEGQQGPQNRYLQLGDEPDTVNLIVNASTGTAGGGLNFNGFNRGGMTITIPVGFTVNVTYKNLAVQSPHSAVFTSLSEIKEANPPAKPVFPGASSPRPHQGITSGTQYFSFKATKTGTFALICAVPGHAVGGQWDYFKVANRRAKPSVKLGKRVETVAIEAAQ